MLKICEECGYKYSSKAEICPKCGCPNSHLIKQIQLEAIKENDKDEIAKSIFCIFLFVVLSAALYWWFDQPWIVSIFIGALFAGVMSAAGVGIIGATVLILLLCYVTEEVLHLPREISDLLFYVFAIFPFYFAIIRPIFKIRHIMKTNKEIAKVHTEDVLKSNEEFYQTARPVNENTPFIAKDAIDVEYEETQNI